MTESAFKNWQLVNVEFEKDKFDRIATLYGRRASRHAKAAAVLGYEHDRLTDQIQSVEGDGDMELGKRLRERAKMVRLAHAREILETAQAGRVLARMASQQYVIDELTAGSGLVDAERDLVQEVVGVADWVGEL